MMTSIVVFGPGCARCKQLEANVRKAAELLGLEFDLVKMTDVRTFASFGIALTPALMINDEVKITGRVPDVEELKSLLQAKGEQSR